MENRDGITLELDKVQKGTIKVHSQIINDLSSGIYSSPASCIKELINNSYDADSSYVTIRIKPLSNTIVLTDDGHGMNAVDFDKNFAWISKSNKRNSGEKTKKFNRPLIGKIGIGFIAVNEICESMKIISSKKGEDIRFQATIDFKGIIDDNKVNQIIKGDYTIVNEREKKDEHYTVIELSDLKETVTNILEDKLYTSQLTKSKERPYYENMLQVITEENNRVKSYKKNNEYTKFIINLASYLPVEYIKDGPIVGVDDPIINEIVNDQKQLKFKVDLDGIILKKPTYFNPVANENYAFESFRAKIPVKYKEEGKNEKSELKFKGYFFTFDHLLTPQELNGIAIRIKRVPIALEYGYDGTFMGYPKHVDQIFRNWISGEIYIESGLEQAMNIDRQSFRLTHPHYITLQEFTHKFLKETFFTDEVKRLYQSNRDKRKEEKVRNSVNRKKEILKADNISIEIKEFDKSIDSDPIGQKTVSIKSLAGDSKSFKVLIDKDFNRKFKRAEWAQLEDIFIVFEKAYNESKGSTDELRRIFYDLITELRGK